METACVTAGPATGPECVKSSRDAPASSSSRASATNADVVSGRSSPPAAASGRNLGAALLDEPPRRLDGCPGPRLQRAVRHVAADERAAHAAPHGAAGEQHLIERDVEIARLPPEVDPDGVAHRDDVHAGAVHDLRHLVVVDHHRDDLPPVALHLLQRRDDDPFRHASAGRAAAPPLTGRT
jgi:hypothetical protein